MQHLSIWEKETFFTQQDVIIVGSGFCGLWSALHLILLNPHNKITILERGLIPTGASTRNAGFSCFGSPSELINDVRVMGEKDMWELVAMRYQGMKEIRRFFSDDEIEYNADGGYECFTHNSEAWVECNKKLEWLNEGLKHITGKQRVFTEADDKLNDFGFLGFEHIIENKLEGSLNPGKLVQALLKKIHSLGVQVLTGIEVLHYHETDNMVTVVTNHNIELHAKQLLLCTNAFTPQLFPSLDIIPNRGQVLITSPIESLRFKGAFHFDNGFYYFRNLGNRLLVGGARNKSFGEENTINLDITDVIQKELEYFIQHYLLVDKSYTITDRWTGIMAMGTHKSPIVRSIGAQVFCCVRMSGMGVALAPVVARQVVQIMSDNL